jgi:hypothetical protein
MKEEQIALEPAISGDEAVTAAPPTQPETITIGAETPNPLVLHRKNMHGTYIYAPQDVEEQPELLPPSRPSKMIQFINSGVQLAKNVFRRP